MQPIFNNFCFPMHRNVVPMCLTHPNVASILAAGHWSSFHFASRMCGCIGCICKMLDVTNLIRAFANLVSAGVAETWNRSVVSIAVSKNIVAPNWMEIKKQFDWKLEPQNFQGGQPASPIMHKTQRWLRTCRRSYVAPSPTRLELAIPAIAVPFFCTGAKTGKK